MHPHANVLAHYNPLETTVRAKLWENRKSVGDDDSATRLLRNRIESDRACSSSILLCRPSGPSFCRNTRDEFVKPPPLASLASPTRRPGSEFPIPFIPLAKCRQAILPHVLQVHRPRLSLLYHILNYILKLRKQTKIYKEKREN